MSAVTKKAIMRAKVEGVLTDLMVKTSTENVWLDDTTTLSAKLAEIITSLNGKATTDALTNGLAGKSDTGHKHGTADVTGLDTALGERPTTDAMNTAISTAISDLIGGAPETYDTLKEIADYIADHEDVVAALNAAIGNKLDAETFSAFKGTITALGALAGKDKVAEGDLDAALKSKIDSASAGNHSHSNKELLDSYTQTEANLADAVSKRHSHSNKTVLDGIDAAKVAVWDGKGKTYVQTSEPAGLTASDLWIQIVE